MLSILSALALAATATDGALHARPRSTATEVAQGAPVKLARDATLYVPRGATPAGGWPLLVVFPGTGGEARRLVATLAGAADQQRFALLGLEPGPRGNYETVERFFDERDARRKGALAAWPAPPFDRDVARLDAALAATFARLPVKRVGLLGYSHGGSFALSVGLANPALIRTVEALSPGLLLLPPHARGGQAVWLSHGKADRAQPYRRTACAMAPKLTALGYDVRFRPREGGHAMDAADLVAALEHFLDEGRTKPTPPPPGC